MHRLAPLVPILVLLACCEPEDGPGDWDSAVDTTGDVTGDGVTDTVDTTPPDLTGLDTDGDGFTPAEGDCNDADRLINPDAWDEPGNGQDDDCDGTEDNPASACDCEVLPSLAAGLDLCDPRFLLDETTVSHAPDAALGRGVRTHYGSSGNDLGVRNGCGYTVLGTGSIDPIVDEGTDRQPGTDFYATSVLECPGTEPDPDPEGGGGVEICDTEQLVLELRAPSNVSGFSFDFIYLSTEYPEWVGLGYNDTFYAIIDRPSTGERLNISFDEFGAEIEVDNAFFEDPPWADLTGSGFNDEDCLDLTSSYEQLCGSSTGWLRTSWSIEAGEEFSLTFSIHDEGDGVWDSTVIIDNFQWSTDDVDPGTVII